jgi:hypothetical protein
VSAYDSCRPTFEMFIKAIYFIELLSANYFKLMVSAFSVHFGIILSMYCVKQFPLPFIYAALLTCSLQALISRF